MMYKARLAFVMMLAVCAVARGQVSPIAADKSVASGIRLLEAWLESRLAYGDLPGMTLAIVHDQELVWIKGFGDADREGGVPAGPDTIYRIASNTKVFTSTAIMKLRDEGKLRLDDPVEQYLPWFKIKQTYPEAPVITIRHLLTHTSGLPREAGFPYWTDLEFPTREQMIDKLTEQETVYPSETKWKYSNLGFTLAGEIVAAVSGTPYEEYVRRNIIEPLGLTSTSLILSNEQRERLAVGYGRRMPDGSRQIMPFADCKGLAPAADVSSTARDLAKFVAWQFRLRESDGLEILKSSTLREMQRVHWLNPGWTSGWGLGFAVYHQKERDLIGHGGAVPGHRSAVYISPAEKVAVIALCNADDASLSPGSPYSVIDKAFAWVAPAMVAATSRVQPAIFDPTWEKYVGVYTFWWGDSQIMRYDERLVMINPTSFDPSASMTVLTPLGEHVFRMDGGGYGAIGEPLTFELDAEGCVERMKMGENYMYPRE